MAARCRSHNKKARSRGRLARDLDLPFQEACLTLRTIQLTVPFRRLQPLPNLKLRAASADNSCEKVLFSRSCQTPGKALLNTRFLAEKAFYSNWLRFLVGGRRKGVEIVQICYMVIVTH